MKWEPRTPHLTLYPNEPISACTNEGGEAQLTLPIGVWLLDTMEMIQAKPELDAEWDSVWARLRNVAVSDHRADREP